MQTALMNAAKAGDLASVTRNIERISKQEGHALQEAIDQKGSFGKSALHLAAENGHDAIVRTLLGIAGINANPKDTNGKNPLILAAKNGHEAVVRTFLAFNDVAVNERDDDNLCALEYACIYNHAGTVDALCLDPNINTDIVSIAINGIRITHQKYLEKAQQINPGIHARIRTMLEQHSQNKELFLQAARLGNENYINANRNLKYNLRAVDAQRKTALILAAENGHTQIVALLLTMPDVNANSLDQNHWSALMHASHHGHIHSFNLLHAKPRVDINVLGTRLNPVGYQVFTENALSLATRAGHIYIMMVLLNDRKIITSSRAFNGDTILMIAASMGNIAAVDAILGSPYQALEAETFYYGRVRVGDSSRGLYAAELALKFGHAQIANKINQAILQRRAQVAVNGGGAAAAAAAVVPAPAIAPPLVAAPPINKRTLQQRLQDIGFDEDLPAHLTCPISFNIMDDPITLASSGQTYDRQSLILYFANKNNPETLLCPITQKIIRRIDILITATNFTLKALCEDFVIAQEQAQAAPAAPKAHPAALGIFAHKRDISSDDEGDEEKVKRAKSHS